jgi:DNA repair photolyase
MSTSSSLETYWGGFLYNSLSPLELTLNLCSHRCVYCFANLNQPDRTAQLKQATNLLSELWDTTPDGSWKRSSYAAHLLREGYPVTISNHVDPLAASNAFQALPMIEMLRGLNIDVSIMTKFGKRRDTEALFDLLDKPTSFYVSLATLNADLVREFEPGAPLPEERLEFIQAAIARGHYVSVGINPIVAGWIDDPAAMAAALYQSGVKAVWLNKLHLSHKQLKQMTDQERQGFDPYIPAALYPKKHPEVQALYDAVDAACREAGLDVYANQQGKPSSYFDYEGACYRKKFPVMQDFVNYCWQTKQAGEPIYWEEFRDFFVPKLPSGEWGLRDHINAQVVPAALNGKFIPQRMDYETLLWHIWQHKETLYCPANVDCFAWAGDPLDDHGKNWIRVEDANHLPILTFQPQGTNNYAYTANHSL